MDKTLRILIVEDSEDDAELIVRELSRGGCKAEVTRVETAQEMERNLAEKEWDAVISDYVLPSFGALAALSILKASGLDIPFIVLSGNIGEETAVEAMKAGAHDYLMKNNMKRLVPAIEREMREAESRRKRLENERALHRSRKQYQSLVDSIEGIVWEGDSTTRHLRFVSPKAESITGYPLERWLKGENFFSLIIHEEDREMFLCTIDDVIEGVKNCDVEYRIITPNGRQMWIRNSMSAVLDEKHAVRVTGVMTDITRHVEAKEALRKTEERLLQVQKMEAIGRLAGGVAHDFNNLLTAIIGYAEVGTMRLNQGDPLRSILEEILKAGERASTLTSKLLAFSRRQMLQMKVLDLNAIISDMEDMLKRVIGEDINLILERRDRSGRVKADRAQIEQVIVNLVINSREAMPNGGTLTIETANVYLDESTLSGRIETQPGPYVVLAVTDSGRGMDSETLSHIFEPFFTTKSKGQGTGLGLSTVYGIVKQSGGDITVESEPGRSTTFRVYLPRVEQPEEIAETGAATAGIRGGPETILVVEDEDMVRRLTCQTLKINGYNVLEAPNPGTALLICEQHEGKIDLLVTDVVMPQMNGRELSDRLAQLRPKMKVLYMSGYTDNVIYQQVDLSAGVNLIQKPFSPHSLLRKVRELLDNDHTS